MEQKGRVTGLNKKRSVPIKFDAWAEILGLASFLSRHLCRLPQFNQLPMYVWLIGALITSSAWTWLIRLVM